MAALLAASPVAALCADGTDSFIKLRDERKRHPRICAISFPGDTRWREAYDDIYGHGAMLENPYAGFRIYMNESQAIDLYLKNRPGWSWSRQASTAMPRQWPRAWDATCCA